jgi:hypothetical protein
VRAGGRRQPGADQARFTTKDTKKDFSILGGLGRPTGEDWLRRGQSAPEA